VHPPDSIPKNTRLPMQAGLKIGSLMLVVVVIAADR
jgi:hypothetical protein